MVANKFVDVEFVLVVLVKMAVDGVEAPIDTLFKVPPVSVTFPEERFVMVPFVANKFVEVADVEVAFVKTAVEAVFAPIGVLSIVPPLIVSAFTTIASVTEFEGRERPPVTAKFVVVALVPVAFVQMRPVTVPFVANKFVEKEIVEVELVDVTF